MPDDVLEREIEIAAPPERVWQLLTTPDGMTQWMGTHAELDPRPGGVYKVNVTGRDVARGEFVTVEPHTRLVYTWGWEGEGAPIGPGGSTVEMTLSARSGGTLLRLVHRGLGDSRDAHAEGWNHFIERLVQVGAGEDPGQDPWVAAAASQA